ncbi:MULTISPECIES: hypothetical protein [unclassified Prochlorococcus]
MERAGVTGEKLVKSSDLPSRQVFATTWSWVWDVDWWRSAQA